MIFVLLIAGTVACSIPATDYCGTNELKPIELDKLFADDDRHREYHGLYHRSNKIMYFDGKPYLELELHPHPESK